MVLPPERLAKWGERSYQLTAISSRIWAARVESWWFEVWNEPDIPYGTGRRRSNEVVDFAADGVKRALPTARIGGPGDRAQRRADAAIPARLHRALPARDELRDRDDGSPIDLVTFHAKGAPRVQPDGRVRMSVSNQLRAISNGFGIVASFPELKNVPIVIGESDPEGCAACPVRTNPSNAYRNGTMFSSYTAEQIARTYQLADLHKVNLLGSVTWAFLFEGQPYFDGFRDLATNGIDKPVINVFRMLGLMRGQRVSTRSSAALTVEGRARSKRPRSADVVRWRAAMRARRLSSSGTITTTTSPSTPLGAGPPTWPGRHRRRIDLTILGVPDGRPTLTHYASTANTATRTPVGKPWALRSRRQSTDRGARSVGTVAANVPPSRGRYRGRTVVTFSLPVRCLSDSDSPGERLSVPAM